MQDRRSVSINH